MMRELSDKRKKEIELELERIHKSEFSVQRQSDYNELKNIILFNPRDTYDWYINKRDNFITIIFKDKNIPKKSYNGFGLEDLTNIFIDCNKENEMGTNLFDSLTEEDFFQ